MKLWKEDDEFLVGLGWDGICRDRDGDIFLSKVEGESFLCPRIILIVILMNNGFCKAFSQDLRQ